MPLVRGGYAIHSPADLLAGNVRPYRSNMNRADASSDVAAVTSGVMLSVAVPLMDGDLISKIAFRSGATAAGTPTHYFFALYDASGNLLQQTADQTSTAWAADTVKDLALAATVQVTTTGVYYAAIAVAATTLPTLVGVTLARAGASTGILSSDKVLAQTSGSGLTATAPATIATPTAVVNCPLVVCH